MFPLLLAAQDSYLMWYIRTLGIKGILLLPFAAILSFAITLFLVSRRHGRLSGSALLLLVMLPILAGFYCMLESVIGMLIVFSRVGDDVTLKPSEVAEGISGSLLALHTGFTLSVPTILIALVGLVFRAASAESSSVSSTAKA
ncbi:MAG: hypothetical protein ACO1RA_03130 [Planctomycetaceae bacterium]